MVLVCLKVIKNSAPFRIYALIISTLSYGVLIISALSMEKKIKIIIVSLLEHYRELFQNIIKYFFLFKNYKEFL